MKRSLNKTHKSLRMSFDSLHKFDGKLKRNKLRLHKWHDICFYINDCIEHNRHIRFAPDVAPLAFNRAPPGGASNQDTRRNNYGEKVYGTH